MNVRCLTASIFRVVSRSYSSTSSSFRGRCSSSLRRVHCAHHRRAAPSLAPGIPTVFVVVARGNKSSAMRGVKKENLPTKVCVVCDRPFTWRKKWERCWDEVTTCSKSCNASRKREKNGSGDAEEGDDEDEEEGGDARVTTDVGRGGEGREARREERKAAKKAVKASKRNKRGGGGDGDGDGGESLITNDGKKACDGCGKRVDLLIRCQVDESKKWKMLCGGKCWKKASGGVPDGDTDHPHYRYGGLWKNRKAARHVSTSVPALKDTASPSSEKEEEEEEEMGVKRELAELQLA